ncbi:MAG TPA: hypothetical protein VNN76_12075 [Bacteroidota bacterium]|nr:hypothetical protein [Bacteroidota bacterium]
MPYSQVMMLEQPMKHTEGKNYGPDSDEALDFDLSCRLEFSQRTRVSFTPDTQWEDCVVIYRLDAGGQIMQPAVHSFCNYALFGEHTWAQLGADQRVVLEAGNYLFTAWTKDAPPYSPNRWRQIPMRRRQERLEANDGSSGEREEWDDVIVTWREVGETRNTGGS